MEQCVAECKNHNFDSNALSYISFFQFLIETADYLSVMGGVGTDKKEGGGGGHMNFHVASSVWVCVCGWGGGVVINFCFPARGWVMF